MTPVTHQIKVWPSYYVDVVSLRKPFEVRKNDRDYRAGDYLHLCEWDPKTEEFTGQSFIVRISYMLEAGQSFGALDDGYVVLGFDWLELLKGINK
jgi:hypothetical protein